MKQFIIPVGVVLLPLLLIGHSMITPVDDSKQMVNKADWFNEICIDGVVYLSRTSRLSVKFNVDSTVVLCDDV